MWDRELREASQSFTELFFPSVQAQLVGEIGQSFSTICIFISKEASVFVRLFPPSTTSGVRSTFMLRVSRLTGGEMRVSQESWRTADNGKASQSRFENTEWFICTYLPKQRWRFRGIAVVTEDHLSLGLVCFYKRKDNKLYRARRCQRNGPVVYQERLLETLLSRKQRSPLR